MLIPNQLSLLGRQSANPGFVLSGLQTSCVQLKSRYGDKLNFVMLNIENSRWLPEMAEYRVSGVPHFVFLDAQGAPQAATIGRLPKEVILSDHPEDFLACFSSGSFTLISEI